MNWILFTYTGKRFLWRRRGWPFWKIVQGIIREEKRVKNENGHDGGVSKFAEVLRVQSVLRSIRDVFSMRLLHDKANPVLYFFVDDVQRDRWVTNTCGKYRRQFITSFIHGVETSWWRSMESPLKSYIEDRPTFSETSNLSQSF